MKTSKQFLSFIFMVIFGISFAPSYAIAFNAPSPDTSFLIRLATLTNNARADNGASPLFLSSTLTRAAQKKADDMARNGYFSHYSPTGISPWHWFTSAGYRYTRAGENLAMNFDSPEKVLSAWMNSPLHRANITKSLYTEIGIGISRGSYRGKQVTFIVEFFATPARSPSKILARNTR